MQLSCSRQASQAKEDLGSVGTLLSAEEDDGLATLEGAAGQGEQYCFLIPYAVALHMPDVSWRLHYHLTALLWRQQLTHK